MKTTLTKRPPSPIGESGYTLMELLVILTIMALLTAAAPALISAGRVGAEIKSAAQILANNFRTARSTAVLQNSLTHITLNPDQPRHILGPHDQEYTLPSNMNATLIAADGKTPISEIDFFPDGSSTGGQLILQMQKRRSTISVGWITGLVSIDE